MKKLSALVIMVALATFSNGFTSSTETTGDDRWIADVSAKSLANPFKGDKSSIKKGRELFKLRCVVCHGEGGNGDGPGSKALNPKPANLASQLVQSQTDGELFWKISEGRGPMITWKKIIQEQDRWHLVDFLRTLPH